MNKRLLRGSKKALSGSKSPIGILAGQYYDVETGLHYNYHRYYDPATGRYLTPDPIGLEGGINLYVYVQNNPSNYVDPLGLIPPGHHYFPKEIFKKLDLPDEAYDYFMKTTTGKIPQSKTFKHLYDTEHRNYTEAVRKLWEQYHKKHGIDSCRMTKDQAVDFIDKIKKSKAKPLKGYLDKIKAVQKAPNMGIDSISKHLQNYPIDTIEFLTDPTGLGQNN